MSQTQLQQNIAFTNLAKEENWNSTTSLNTTDINNISDSLPTSTYTYKPVLVKADKNSPNRDASKISQSIDNAPLRDNNSLESSRNSSNSSNSSTSAIRLIDIVPSTVARIDEVYSSVKRKFVYKPNVELMINAIIETGKFNSKLIADNICTVFSEKQATNNRTSAIHLSESNLAKCRLVQMEVRNLLEMDIDIHPILNSMIYTGRYNPKDIESALRKLFSEKRKTMNAQKSNHIN